MRALEKLNDVNAMTKTWQDAFRLGAEAIGKTSRNEVFWHERLGIWGVFGKSVRETGSERNWNAFGQQPHDFRSNIIVEINQPRSGIDHSLQGVFARDEKGQNWLLHQGRMSIPGSRITESDFSAATGWTPTNVAFSDGSQRNYHKVANLRAHPAVVQENIAAFIAICANVRQKKLARDGLAVDASTLLNWERGLRPELTGSYEYSARNGGVARRVHGEIWKILTAELNDRDVPHTNGRVGQYGPDLVTEGYGQKVLFEIKSQCYAEDIFKAIGQLHIYEMLLKDNYRKVLVLPKGMGEALKGPVSNLNIKTVEFHKAGKEYVLDLKALTECLK